ncbi:hypothetical protein DMUE_3779 [Dictyocoela muelleri]|nr:hypothetical protein DMUE_3779 [Dictyocoela muelleri]
MLDEFKSEEFISELKEIFVCVFLSKSITKIEGNNLFTTERIEIIKNVELNLDNKILIEKMCDLIDKNPDLIFFLNLNEITYKAYDKIYLYVLLTTIERCFSRMVHILDDLRRSLTVKLQEMLPFLYYNKNK